MLFFYALLVTLLLLLVAWGLHRAVRARFPDGPVQAPPPAPSPFDFVPPTAPIEMRLSRDIVIGSVTSAIGLLLFAIGFYVSTEGSWLRWLAWPAGAVAIGLAAWSLRDGWSESGTHITADSTGVHFDEGGFPKRITWSRVDRVRVVEHWGRDAGPSRARRLYRRKLILQAADGAELLQLDYPLRPAEACKTFIASVPVWTGKAVELERVGR